MMMTQEAAACLGFNQAYLLGLLEEGKLAYEKLGQERRLQKAEVIAYQQRRREEGYAALREMVRLNQEMGLYD